MELDPQLTPAQIQWLARGAERILQDGVITWVLDFITTRETHNALHLGDRAEREASRNMVLAIQRLRDELGVASGAVERLAEQQALEREAEDVV